MTVLDKECSNCIYKSFFFLLKDCDYTISEEYQPGIFNYTRNNYVITYISLKCEKQIEVALLSPGYNVEIYIRKLTGVVPAPYNNEKFCISYTLLLNLLSPPEPDRITYSHTPADRLTVIKNAGELFYNFTEIFCTSNWFDLEKIKKIKNEYYLKKWGKPINEYSRKKIHELIKHETAFLTDINYQVLHDSDKMPPYAINFWFIIYTNGVNSITISQSYPQDGYYYYIKIITKTATLFRQQIPAENIVDQIADIIKDAI